jgi:DNA-binding SARP family transcriptional activator
VAQLQVTLLGGFRARTGSGGAVAFPTRKAQALLAYLGAVPGRAHPRDKLATLLWGERSEEQARHSLRQALFALRRVLPPGALVAGADTVALDPAAVDVDVVAFERDIAEGTPAALAAGAARYQGDLLAGLSVAAAPEFDDWLLGERERLRELALEGLAKLLAHRRSTGVAEAAIETALRLLALDPLQEPAHRTLMRLYADAGRRGAALRQYQQCVAILQRELGAEPEAETQQLYQQILRRRGPARAGGPPDRTTGLTLGTSRAPMAEIPLVGRTAELGRLRAALADAAAGRGGVVAVIGEAGIGKTRLVGELLAAAEVAGARVLLGRAYESEQVLPFGPWVDALRAGHAVGELHAMAAGRADLAHLLPELAEPDVPGLPEPPDFLKVFESVSAAIGVLAGPRPLVLALEDLHWADEMSLRLLAFLGRRLPSRRVLAVVTARDEELADAAMLRRVLDELRHAGHLDTLGLAALSRADTLTLVHSLARAGTDQAALARLGDVAWDASGGNPFVVVETIRSQTQGVGPLSEPVRQLVTRRLERLSERARLVTTVAAVIGREFEFTLVQQAAGLRDAEAAEAVEELVRRRVLHGVGERFDFTHDRIREVVRADLLAPRRRLLHRSVAEAIEALHADDLDPHVLALALHYHGAEMWREALRYLRRAADHAAARSAYREAATCLERALEAATHLPRSAEILDQTLDLQLQLRTVLWPLADFERIARCLEDAEGLAAALEDRAREGRIAAFMSVLRWVTGDFRTARRLARRARELAASLDDPALGTIAAFYLGLAHQLLGQYPEAEDAYVENARALATVKEPYLLGAPRWNVHVLSAAWLVLPLAERGAFADGLGHGRAALDAAEAADEPYGIVSAGYCLAYLHCLQGDVERAIPLLERAVAICGEREFGVWLPQVTGYLGHAYTRAGRLDEGRALLARAIEVYDATRAWPFRTLMTAHQGMAELLAGRPDAARTLAEEALRLTREHGERGHEAWARRLLGEIAARRDPPDTAEAEHHYREAGALAGELGMRPLLAHIRHGLGALGRRAGREDETGEHAVAARAMYRELDMRPWPT